MDKNKCDGYVLLIVLIFLQVFSAMGIYALTSASIALRVNREWWQRDINLLMAKSILHDLEAHFEADAMQCRVEHVNAVELHKMPISWWQQHACNGNLTEVPYYYVTEELTRDPCGSMGKDANNQQLIAGYYRITLHIVSRIRGVRTVLQSTVAAPVVDKSVCHGELHPVQAGRQNWREI